MPELPKKGEISRTGRADATFSSSPWDKNRLHMHTANVKVGCRRKLVQCMWSDAETFVFNSCDPFFCANVNRFEEKRRWLMGACTPSCSPSFANFFSSSSSVQLYCWNNQMKEIYMRHCRFLTRQLSVQQLSMISERRASDKPVSSSVRRSSMVCKRH